MKTNPSPAAHRFAVGAWVLAALLLGGCTAPIGARRVTTQQAFDQVEANALRTGKPSASTVVVLHRYELDRLAARQPDEAVRRLHQQAVATGERDLLFALAELSYVTGERLRHVVKPWDSRDPRDFYLGSAVYAWLFLFGDGKDPKPVAVDRRYRLACDFYNYSLGLALTERKQTNGVVLLSSCRRRLPVGELELRVSLKSFPFQLAEFDRIILADQFQVYGLSVRNRKPGLGAPLICVKPLDPGFGAPPCTPATVLLRGPASLAEVGSRASACSLELYSAFGETTTEIAGARMPLEVDLTAYRAYALNHSRVWSLGNLSFLAPAERIPNQLLMNQPYDPGRIPVVFIHGTFSSPVTWAEMVNSLIADPVLRQRCQIWSFIYGSGNPLVQSVADLRSALTDQVQKLDPAGTNAGLRQMVLIGHSQGGLLTKSTAIDAEDRLWRVINTNRLEKLDISETRRAELRRLIFLEPLPFVRRVVFIATPHRGSYLAGGFARRLAQRFVSLPSSLLSSRTDMIKLTAGSEGAKFFRDRMPTSLDGMSPKNPALLAMAEIPVVPGIKAHSIIPVSSGGDYRHGRDGVVAYQSAHVDYVQSEFIVGSAHSCLDHPATIQEVRRILHEHLIEFGENRN
jgi:pimeloyl-ACP methyl ester carboxylesterase